MGIADFSPRCGTKGRNNCEVTPRHVLFDVSRLHGPSERLSAVIADHHFGPFLFGLELGRMELFELVWEGMGSHGGGVVESNERA
jgi:hypothetical protein